MTVVWSRAGLDLGENVLYPGTTLQLFEEGNSVADQASTRRPIQVDKDLAAIFFVRSQARRSLADDALINKLNEAISRGLLKTKRRNRWQNVLTAA